ncbi:hypothetical protein SDC9_52107 [bioreactor metagenome]|uniref:Uncharacterized protein n=1 Tax=bioreactor metagenome TaxID=1076179 RepID=A0A644WPZ6_9ZZZZ
MTSHQYAAIDAKLGIVANGISPPRADSGLRPSLGRKHSVCSPLRFTRLIARQSLDCKHSVCLAKIAGYAVDPPSRRLASPFRFAPGLAQLRASLFANLRFALRLGSTTLACRLTPQSPPAPQKIDERFSLSF